MDSTTELRLATEPGGPMAADDRKDVPAYRYEAVVASMGRHPCCHEPEVRPLVAGAGASVKAVRCPACANLDDKVVDSRMADDGATIRRRRECLGCGNRFTTFERQEEQQITVIKRSGDRVPFDRAKVEAGLIAAAKSRPVTLEQIADVVSELEDHIRPNGEVTSEQVGLAILERLRDLDQVAYVRFASVYKNFDDAADFQREVTLLIKDTEPKRH